MADPRIQAFCTRLASLDILRDAVIVEEYTQPTMPRPVLKKYVSVGFHEFCTSPASQSSFTLRAKLGVKLLFPCGMGESDITEAVTEICTEFSGITLGTCFVESVETGTARFDSTAYAVRVDITMSLNMRELISNSSHITPAQLILGNTVFPKLPDSVEISRPAPVTDADGTKTACAREIRLKGGCFGSPDSEFAAALIAFSATLAPVTLALPYVPQMSVLAKTLSLTYPCTGYGFEYDLTLTESS